MRCKYVIKDSIGRTVCHTFDIRVAQKMVDDDAKSEQIVNNTAHLPLPLDKRLKIWEES